MNNRVDEVDDVYVEYLEYLSYVQLSSQPEPMETYVDWAGLEVLSFKDWVTRNKR